MKLESLKSRLNNQKKKQIKGKITKSSITFNENKANFVNPEICVIPFQTSIYEILSARWSKNQTQFKPNTNPIPERPKMNTSSIITMNYRIFPRLSVKKQTHYKPKQSQFRYPEKSKTEVRFQVSEEGQISVSCLLSSVFCLFIFFLK